MALEAKNIWFRYADGQPWILRDCSIRLDRGERLALTSPSGSGKTTLALLLAGYRKPQRGAVLLDGQPLPRGGICPVQLIFQHPEQAVNPRWRMKRVLEESSAYAPELIERLGIARAWLDRYPRELSGGELQRFCVARALMSGAPYLILDEISTMLDAVTQAQLWQVLLSEAEKRQLGLLVITHNIRLAERVATRVQLPENTAAET